MVLIAVGDRDLAMEIGRLIQGNKSYALPSETDTAMRRQIHEAQPDVVILDVTLGGQRWSAAANIAKIAAVRSAPAILLLAPRASRQLDRVAAASGCYDVVVRALKNETTARLVAGKAHEARQWREERLFSAVPVDAVLH